MSGEVTTESDFFLVWIWDIFPKLQKRAQKRNKLFNQFSNICYVRTSFDLKMQGIFETSNQREYLKCGKIIMRSQFRYWKLLNQFDNFCHPNN